MIKLFYLLLFSGLFFAQPLLSEDLKTPLPHKESVPLPENPYLFPEEPTVVPESNFMAQFFYMLLMLGLLISVMLFSSWFLKRMLNTRIQQANTSSGIKVIEQRSISQRTNVFVLDIEDKTYVIAETGTMVACLSPVSLPPET